MRDPTLVEDAELLEALRGVSLPFDFADPSDGVVLARSSREQYVALLIVYPWEFDAGEDDSDRYPYEQDIAIFARQQDDAFAYEATAGSDWRLGLDRLPSGVPPWLSGFQAGCRFGTFFSGAVSDPHDLRRLAAIGADAVPAMEDAPTGAFVVRFRDDEAAVTEWEMQLSRPDIHVW